MVDAAIVLGQLLIDAHTNGPCSLVKSNSTLGGLVKDILGNKEDAERHGRHGGEIPIVEVSKVDSEEPVILIAHHLAIRPSLGDALEAVAAVAAALAAVAAIQGAARDVFRDEAGG